MRSIHIIGSAGLGGAESFFMRLACALKDQGDDVLCITRNNSRLSHELNGRIAVQQMALANQWDLISRYRIKKCIQAFSPSVVQTYMTRATRLTHIPANQGVVHVARLGGYYNVKRFAHAHAWVGNTRGICDYLIEKGLPKDKVFYIGNFVNQPVYDTDQQQKELRSALGLPDDAFTIMALGRFVEKKGFDVLLNAFDLLTKNKTQRPVHLVLLGDGPMAEQLKQQASQFIASKNIHWIGWCTNPTPYFQLSDIFVCPSNHEPLGNVILEGWYHQKPVISTATQGAVELINDDENGVLVPIGEPVAMAQAMSCLLGDEQQRQVLAQAGFKIASRCYSKEAILGQYNELYKKLSS